MSLDGITVDTSFFEPIRASEEVLEGLIRTSAPALFPGYQYFDFRPPIRCGGLTRHPDGALLASDDSTWWVVEVETHLHSVSEHIEPQLRDLANGFYGPDAYAFLYRHSTFRRERYDVNVYEPAFLLVADMLTGEIRDAAVRTGFQAVECAPFRSPSNQYALAVSGHRPRRDISPANPGLDLVLEEEANMAVLCPLDGKPLPPLPSEAVLIEQDIYPTFVRADKRGLVLPVSPATLRALLPEAVYYRLLSSSQLIGVPQGSATIFVKE